jgi:hypothetical protein
MSVFRGCDPDVVETISDASQDQLVRLARYASTEARQTLKGGEMQIMRVLSEVCAPDVEIYDPGPATGDDSAAGVMLVGAEPLGILDVEVSGTGEEPVISIALLPVGDTPFTASVVDRWGPGERGNRSREVRWLFEWDSGKTRQIIYRLEHSGRGDDYTADARRRSALMLASVAGWPLPAMLQT